MTTVAEQATPDAGELFAPDGYATAVIQYRVARMVDMNLIPASERDDVEQDLSLRLLKRLPGYDPQRSRLKTFISRVVRYEGQEILRLRYGNKHVQHRKARSLDTPVGGQPGQHTTLGDLVTRSQQVRGRGRTEQDDQQQLELRNDLETVMATLPPRLRDLCERLMETRDPEAVCKSVSPQTLAALRRRFEKAGLRFYL